MGSCHRSSRPGSALGRATPQCPSLLRCFRNLFRLQRATLTYSTMGRAWSALQLSTALCCRAAHLHQTVLPLQLQLCQLWEGAPAHGAHTPPKFFVAATHFLFLLFGGSFSQYFARRSRACRSWEPPEVKPLTPTSSQLLHPSSLQVPSSRRSVAKEQISSRLMSPILESLHALCCCRALPRRAQEHCMRCEFIAEIIDSQLAARKLGSKANKHHKLRKLEFHYKLGWLGRSNFFLTCNDE